MSNHIQEHQETWSSNRAESIDSAFFIDRQAKICFNWGMAKRKVRRKKRKQISQTNFIILLVATIAMASVSLFLFLSRPSELDKLNTSYIDSLDKDTNVKELVKE